MQMKNIKSLHNSGLGQGPNPVSILISTSQVSHQPTPASFVDSLKIRQKHSISFKYQAPDT